MGKEAELIKLLRADSLTVSTAESLTGGLTAATLVNVPGASYAFMEGFVTYDIRAKHRTLGIPQDILDEEGAISPITVREMAKGAAKRAGTDMALATTGNAGPDPSEGKPVGLVYTAVYFNGDIKVSEHHFTGTRSEIREKTVHAVIEEALMLLKEHQEQH